MRAARRVGVRPWRDPRLLLGIMLVLLSTVVGAKVFAAKDDTVAFWSLRSSVAAGHPVQREDLVSTRVRLSSGVGKHYIRVSDEFPARMSELVWSRDMEGGSLLARSALVEAGERPAAELPLSVANGAYPPDLRAGDRVDVWVGPAPGQSTDQDSRRVLHAVAVLAAGDDSRSIGGSLARTVLVGVGSADLSDRALGAISAGYVTLVRIP